MALYNRRILNDPEVRLAYGDPLIPIVRADEVTLELSNEDGFFDELDLRGERVTYDRFDAFSQVQQLSELTGIVTDQNLELDRVVLRTVLQDLDDLQTLLPKRTVEATIFPLAHPQQGLGRPIPIKFGNASSTSKVLDSWELPYVTENTSLNQYDYLLGEGTLTNVSIYRNTVGETLFLVPASEYTITSSAYSGFTVARFALRQANFSGGMHRIFGAADGLQNERNPAIAAQSIFGNTSWGLGLPVNSDSFSDCASDITAIGSLYCDGVIVEQRPAIDWLSQLFLFRGMSPSKNTSGQWTITADTGPTVVQATFGHGENQPWVNVVAFDGLRKTPTTETIRSLILDYRKDIFTGQYVLSTATRNPMSVGKDLRIQNDFIRDRTTADKVAHFISKQIQYGDERLSFTTGQEGRRLHPGDLINYESTRPVIDRTFRVTAISRRLDTTQVNARSWNSNIYVYTAGTLPSEPVSMTMTDYSRSTPTAATSLSVTSSSVEQNDQGTNVAYMTLQYTVPDESWARTLVRYTKDGETVWTSLPGENGSGVKTTKITGLTGQQIYDLRVTRENAMNATLAANADLANQTAPGDTTPPSNPTAIAVRQSGGKVIEIDVTFTAPSDWGTTILYRNTTNNSGTATEIERGKKKRFHDQNVSYGTTYYYWVKVADRSGNLSGFSPSSSHSITVAKIITGDVEDDTITTPKVTNGAITSNTTYSNDSFEGVTSEEEVGTVTITTDGGRAVVQGSCQGVVQNDGTASTWTRLSVRLRKDSISGSIFREMEIYVPSDMYVSLPMTLIGTDASPSGSQTYKLTAIRESGDATCGVELRRMNAENQKK